jgi:hypothetical protein
MKLHPPISFLRDSIFYPCNPRVSTLAGPVPKKRNVCVRQRLSAVNYGAISLPVQRLTLSPLVDSLVDLP